jgi:Haem-binding domain
MKQIILGIILVLLVAFVVIQLIPVDRSNPAVAADMPTLPEVKAILKRACYDCHSHETVWPWYSYVAPVSWWVAKDVHQGREELNFSTWDAYSTKERVEKMQESWEEVEEGAMPPWGSIRPPIATHGFHARTALCCAHGLLRLWGAGSLMRVTKKMAKKSETIDGETTLGATSGLSSA